jgi:SAM-dependent methyltransferase
MMVNVLSAFAETVFVDYRPLPAHLENLHPVAGDIARLPFADASVASISCLHVIEHIGLGRYGDALDTEGSQKAAAELARVVSPGGRLYLSAPVGRERVCFNAHRVFDPGRLAGMFRRMSLAEFSFVDDRGRLHEHQSPESAQSNDYACGLYIFFKQ